ncbi:NAD-dependent epimerase/dehydratase family protein [Parashewanella spongiae]|uniref:NAD-dependent epimerase/dehydratase family protein n=1 Tax=Parashewanella spongiae TaxID=342950 RepID=A0A3A6T1W0_9GAMM|nr:NAD-dependent epimerase/dehydratase family protein [Parashewanella spongiae]
MNTKKPILVTGVAGFIGFHIAKRLLEMGMTVIGIDNLNDYYDPMLKVARLGILQDYETFRFTHGDLADLVSLEQLFYEHEFDYVVHLAAQVGVRYPIEAPVSYSKSNLVGMTHILECCRHHNTKHLLFASSSSVYGTSNTMPLAETAPTDEPVSLYAATKKANEVMAYSYSKLYQLPITGMRFFTVYGPWNRPDMALFKFVEAIDAEQEVTLYNYGKMMRDFTYIDDVVDVISSLMVNRLNTDKVVPFELYNIGSNNPQTLFDFISVIENTMGEKAKLNLHPIQAGDVQDRWADVTKLKSNGHPLPKTSLQEGIQSFVDWYHSYTHDA